MFRRHHVCVLGAALAVLAAQTQKLPAADEKAKDKPVVKFEVYQDASSEYRWRLVAAEGKDAKVLATGGQGYKAKADAKHGVEILQKGAAEKLTFESYQDKVEGFRWRAKSSNGQVVASSPSSFKTKADCDAALDLIKKNAATATVEEVKPAKT